MQIPVSILIYFYNSLLNPTPQNTMTIYNAVLTERKLIFYGSNAAAVSEMVREILLVRVRLGGWDPCLHYYIYDHLGTVRCIN